MNVLLDALTVGVGAAHVLLAPYTKVEESFNLHATHDVLIYGIQPAALANYDHFVFPGAVPRTFIGSILLAWLSTPVIWLAQAQGLVHSKLDLQIIVRIVLATLNAVGLNLIRRAVSHRFGRLASLYFMLFTLSQFHIPFWMGRTLPNMFALFPVNVSTYLVFDGAGRPSSKRTTAAMSLLTFTAVVFRAEVALYLAPLALQCLYRRSITFTKLIFVGFVSGMISLALTTVVDSYFWRQPVWPEFAGIYFNVVLGKSSDWGVDPPLTYFTTYLPRMTMTCTGMAGLGFLIDARVRTLLLPPLCFMAIISALGHKEWRFIIYVVPIFNIAAARTARWMTGVGKNRLSGRLLFAGTLGIVILQCLFTYVHTLASMANYPGGEALRVMNEAVVSSPPHVHISNLAAQTGASLFLQEHEGWIYNKTEKLTTEALFSSPVFTHLIAEPMRKVPKEWVVADTIEGFNGWYFTREHISDLTRWREVVRMSKSTQLLIMKRKY